MLRYLIDNQPVETAIFIGVLAVGLWIWKAPTRAQMWRWLEFNAGLNAEANEMKEARRAMRRQRMRDVEVEAQ